MPSKLFHITKYYRNPKYVICYIQGRKGSVNVPRSDFEYWLETHDKLEYETEITVDHNGDPTGGEPATMDMHGYWSMNSEIIINDLYDYIAYNTNCDIVPAIKRITSDPSVVKQYRRAI